jgi:CHAD domain-containing protein
MEIEAKFALPDLATSERLQSIGAVAGFVLSPGHTELMRDMYLDTADRKLMLTGYACRWREEGSDVLITLKELGMAEGAVHRREEQEVVLPGPQPPSVETRLSPERWPSSPVREHVLELIGNTSLLPLFRLEQSRAVRMMSKGERDVAELSLHDVRMFVRGEEQVFSELEVELASQGTEQDLASIVTTLQDEWALEAEPRSKFRRALTFLAEVEAEGGVLSPCERTICEVIAERDDLHGRRARALLALDDGATQAEAGRRAGMSARRVRHWLAELRKGRLDVFPPRVLDAAGPELAEFQPVPRPVSPAEREVEEPVEAWTIDALFNAYNVDAAHAVAVAGCALVLFDNLLPIHGIPLERRPLLETAALVHNVGAGVEGDPSHVTGRDILLIHPPTGLDGQEQAIVATIVLLHRKQVTRQRLDALAESSLAGLPDKTQAETFALAALLRMADGLGCSETSVSQVADAQWRQGLIEFRVAGPSAAKDAARAQKRADLWHLLFTTEVRFTPLVRDPDVPTAVRAPKLRRRAKVNVPAPLSEPGLRVDDTMAEAALKTLDFHFRRMVYHEPGTRLGEDIEELHDMRVATRRMRAALRVFGDYVDTKSIVPLGKGLRRTARVLGAVRDLDVFWEKTARYLETLPPDRQGDLEPLRAAWARERDRSRKRMLDYLRSPRYARFVRGFAAFLEGSGAGSMPAFTMEGEPRPYRVRHVVPVAVYQRLAAVRSYDEWVTGHDVPLERLHRLRIAAKRLRYTLEFFEEVLGPEAKAAIKEIKRLQDHLGDLQDAVVASDLLRGFLAWGTWGRTQAKAKASRLPTQPVIAPGVAAYLAARQAELQKLLDAFPQAWARVGGPAFSELVAASLADF